MRAPGSQSARPRTRTDARPQLLRRHASAASQSAPPILRTRESALPPSYTAAVHELPPAVKLDWKNQTGFKSSGHAHHGELAASMWESPLFFGRCAAQMGRVVTLWAVLMLLLNTLVQALRSWVVLTLGEAIAFQLAGNLVRHLVRLPVAFFERRHVGDLLSRIGSIRPIQELLTQGVVNVGIDAR